MKNCRAGGGRGKNAAIAFDLKTLAKTGESNTGKNPDAICYEPQNQARINNQPQR